MRSNVTLIHMPGDLPGILSKLDYIKELGVGCLWICPFFESPQVSFESTVEGESDDLVIQLDLGYDISNYKDVHKPYGNIADVEALIKGAHE